MCESMYWDLRRTLTHNMLINIIVGNRGGGKTYGFKKWCIDNFIKTGEQFVYVRRYKDELKTTLPTFFNDIYMNYPDYEFRTDNKYFYIRERPETTNEKWTENDIAGFAISLSVASSKKSVSYPKVTTIGFDEFLLEKGLQHYLADEPIKLLNLYETIARPGTDHPRVVMFMLANAITITNPYYLYWDLNNPKRRDKNGKYIWKHKTRPILVENVQNDLFIETKRNTEFGQLVEGTKYAEYSIENKFLHDDDTFIEKKSNTAKYYLTFIFKGNKYGVWIDREQGKMWVSESVDPYFALVYTLTIKDHQPNTMFFKSKSFGGFFKSFIENYKLGLVYFESINVKNICYEVFKMSQGV